MVQGKFSRRHCSTVLFLLLLSLSYATAAATHAHSAGAHHTRPLTLGILPFVSPIALLQRFAPLRDYLSRELGHPILLETARDYPEFARRVAHRHYDIAITAPHFVIPALDDGAYRLQASFLERLSAVVLVQAHGDVRDTASLAGQPVATPPHQAIVTLLGSELIERSMDPGARPLYRAYQTHNAAYHALAGGEVRAAVVSTSIVNPAALPTDGLRELARSQPFPAMGILAASDLPAELAGQLTTVLVGMSAKDAGRRVLQQISYAGYRRGDAAEFEQLRPYLIRARQQDALP